MSNHGVRGRSVEASGRTVDSAVEQALARLGRGRDEVEVQVLRQASRGVLGFGAHDAIVRVTELLPAEPAPPEPASPAAPPAEDRPEPAPEPEEAVEAPAAEAEDEDDYDYEEEDEEEVARAPTPTGFDRDEILNSSRDVLLDILERMNVIADVLATWSEPEDEQDEPTLVLDIIGDDLGLLIGRRGETLRDLQYLLRLIVGRRIQGWANIIVDVEGYKQRREEQVRQMARRVADRVIATGRVAHLEPMNSYERRLVHLELRDVEGVTTKSSGEGERRKVGVYPAS